MYMDKSKNIYLKSLYKRKINNRFKNKRNKFDGKMFIHYYKINKRKIYNQIWKMLLKNNLTYLFRWYMLHFGTHVAIAT